MADGVEAVIDAALEKLTDLQAERMDRAQQFLKGATNVREMLADIANVATVGFVTLEIATNNQGFKSDSA